MSTDDKAQVTRAAIYARVSTDEQVLGTSLGIQQSRCRAHIDGQGWWAVADYVDEGVSGAKASRPALDRLIASVRRGEVDVVVVAKLDRIGRSMRNLAALMGDFDDRGVSLVSISESFDSMTPAGRLQRNMLGSFAEFERALIRDRMASGIEAAAAAGHWPGGSTPFGYRSVRSGRSSILQIDEAEAMTLRRAVDLVVRQRLTTGQAAVELNAAGLLPRKAARWTASILRNVLVRAEPNMSGDYVWRRPSGRGAEGSPPISLSIPPMLSPELHVRLKARLVETTTTHILANRYLLSTRITAPCGSSMTGQAVAGGSLVYRCGGRALGGLAHCACRTVRAELADSVVWSEVEAILSEPARLMAMAGLELGRAEESCALGNEDLAGIDHRIARLTKAGGEQVAKLLSAGLDPMIAQQAVASLNEDLVAAKAQRRRVAAWLGANADRMDQRRRIWDLAAGAAQSLPHADMPTRQRVLELLEVQVQVVSWESCETCRGTGWIPVRTPEQVARKVVLRSGHAPACPQCHAFRRIPVLEIAGVVPDVSSLHQELDPNVARWPFRLASQPA